MKKVSLCLIALLICIMIPASYAAPCIEQESETIYTEFGVFEIETTTVIHNVLARSNSKSADRTHTVRLNGKIVAEVTLSATFGYDGKTSWVTSASGSHSTHDGWSYEGEKITKSGGTARLTAKLTHSRYEDAPINISITCTPTGQIS